MTGLVNVGRIRVRGMAVATPKGRTARLGTWLTGGLAYVLLAYARIISASNTRLGEARVELGRY